jgi:hypothetical protein
MWVAPTLWGGFVLYEYAILHNVVSPYSSYDTQSLPLLHLLTLFTLYFSPPYFVNYVQLCLNIFHTSPACLLLVQFIILLYVNFSYIFSNSSHEDSILPSIHRQFNSTQNISPSSIPLLVLTFQILIFTRLKLFLSFMVLHWCNIPYPIVSYLKKRQIKSLCTSSKTNVISLYRHSVF